MRHQPFCLFKDRRAAGSAMPPPHTLTADRSPPTTGQPDSRTADGVRERNPQCVAQLGRHSQRCWKDHANQLTVSVRCLCHSYCEELPKLETKTATADARTLHVFQQPRQSPITKANPLLASSRADAFGVSPPITVQLGGSLTVPLHGVQIPSDRFAPPVRPL